jgi:hypothetical protein
MSRNQGDFAILSAGEFLILQPKIAFWISAAAGSQIATSPGEPSAFSSSAKAAGLPVKAGATSKPAFPSSGRIAGRSQVPG